MKIIKNMHVLLLKGGFGSERSVSLNSAKACAEAIKENGFKVTEFDIGVNGIKELSSLEVDVCFNALHGKFGEDGTVQGLLNLLKIPYTHSGVTASAIAMNKMHFKRLITNATESSEDPIIFPKTLQIINEKSLHVNNYDFPYVIKPINGGSSVDVNIIKGNQIKTFKENKNYDELMAEVLVGSRELTVTVLKEKPLCVTEITTKNNQDFYNYKAKYEKNGSSHIIPALIPQTIFEKAMSWALRAHQIIGCRGISRTDFRYDSNNNKLFMLELNTQPGMTETSLTPEQALFCNISMKQMVKALIEEANFEC
ncbi:D-alanine--D-alanine ligase [Alphaproteobacteria bacterium]|nr:D-alanine--D-alanine ligase [Alphaproteobacteria bacterium]